ncbi:transcription factor hamlet isoform X3 [Hermetia illucens]|nr:transcription factor hamlet isoform X3 [Hermetia illucens]XP_037902418.1 transcription factor hamlet isoform X3 [Hermetia illucens]XP_037902419.1 transcription factor hamlet isoform X3 [Hermetia illucens]
MNDRNTLEHVVPEISRLREPSEIDIRENGVFAKVPIHSETRYGPFSVKCTSEPADKDFAWEVLAGPDLRSWLEPMSDAAKWLKKIRSTHNSNEVNIRHYVLGGNLWYAVCRDIPANGELITEPKVHLQISDIFGNALTEDRSDRESGSQHSGTTGEDDFNTSNDLDNNIISESNSRSREQSRDSDDEEVIDYRCVVCERQCHDIEHLDDHLIAAHHYPKDAFKCELCPKAFCYRPTLLRHRALVHGELRKYPCENCTKAFCDPSILQRHIRAHHVGARSHACPECGKTFATSSGLKQHTHIHSSVKPFQCEVCFKAYTQFSNLCRHKRMHADCRNQIKCQKCGQSFSTTTSLVKHKRFCDSTSTASYPHQSLHQQIHSQHQQQPSSQGLTPRIPDAMTTPPNPFLMFPNPAQFFSPRFHPYNRFHCMFPPSPAQAPAFPMLFPKPNLEMPLSTATSAVDNGRMSSSPVRIPLGGHYSSRNSTNDDAKFGSHHRTSLSSRSLNSIHHGSNKNNNSSTDRKSELLSPRSRHSRSPEELSLSARMDTKGHTSSHDTDSESFIDVKEERSTPDDKKHINVTSPSPEQQPTSEQPLDLSLAHKRKSISDPKTPELVEKRDRTPQSSSCQASPSPSVTPGPTPSPSPPGPSVVYPTPNYPMLLDAIYQPPGGLSAALQPFPFLGPMGGRPNFDHAAVLRRNGHHFPPKSFHESLIASGLTSGMVGAGVGVGKLKDRYTCKFCGKVFPRSANLTRHLRTHTGEQPYKCKYCERSFSISSNLQRHVRNIHNKERPFRCNLCDRCFGQQTNLDRHLRKHEADASGLGLGVGDSPSSNEADRDDAYFDEIRSFMGKVTYNGIYTPVSLRGADNEAEDGSDVDNDVINEKEPLNNNDSAIEIST